MHLLYIQQLLIPPGGAGNSRSWEFLTYWKSAGHTVEVLTTDVHFNSQEYESLRTGVAHTVDHLGLKLHILPIPYSHHMRFARRVVAFIAFWRQAKRYAKSLDQPDVVLAYTAPLSVADLGRILARRWQVPFFLEVADVWPDVPIGMGIIRNPLLIRWLRRRTKRIYHACRHIFPFSPGMTEQIATIGISRDKLSTTFNGTGFRPSSYAILPQIRDAGPVHLIYTGTLGKANDLSQVLDALAYLDTVSPVSWRLTIVGDGNDADKVAQRAKELALSQVEFHQRVPQAVLQDLWDGADIGIISFASFPVLEANAATKFFDYHAAGLPVLLNYEGWQAEFIRTHGTGLASKQGDIRAFARNALFLIQQAAIRRSMGRKAQIVAKRLFDRKEISKQLIHQIEKSMTASYLSG